MKCDIYRVNKEEKKEKGGVHVKMEAIKSERKVEEYEVCSLAEMGFRVPPGFSGVWGA